MNAAEKFRQCRTGEDSRQHLRPTKISYANVLAKVCETAHGSHVDVVTAVPDYDGRIGPEYLQVGLGFGGPCFPRDDVAFSASASANGIAGVVGGCNRNMNKRQPGLAIPARLPESVTVGVLGLPDRPLTDVIDESQGVILAQQAANKAVRGIVDEPAAMGKARQVLTGNVAFARSAVECAESADASGDNDGLAGVPGIAAGKLEYQSRALHGGGLWRLPGRDALVAAAEYVTLGLCPNDRLVFETAAYVPAAGCEVPLRLHTRRVTEECG